MRYLSAVFSRQWRGYLAFTVLFAVVCVGLGQWQFARRAEAQAQIALLNANYDAEPRDLASVVDTDADTTDSIKWAPVTAQGEYLASETVYVRNRPLAGRIGFHMLVPFQTTDGLVFVVDRGWVDSNADNSAPATQPRLPEGIVTITARLYPSEPTIAGRSAPAGQVATIHVPTIVDGHSDSITSWFGQIATESPAGTLGTEFSKPVLDEGPHLSYALQWYVFAIMAFVALGWGIRRDVRGESAPISPKPRSREARRDEEIEDAAWEATPTR
ncbi:MAG: SURF1 family protein [Microbacteriaceae bacterium]